MFKDYGIVDDTGKKEIDEILGGGFEYIYEIGGNKLKAIVGDNGFIVSFYPI